MNENEFIEPSRQGFVGIRNDRMIAISPDSDLKNYKSTTLPLPTNCKLGELYAIVLNEDGAPIEDSIVRLEPIDNDFIPDPIYPEFTS